MSLTNRIGILARAAALAAMTAAVILPASAAQAQDRHWQHAQSGARRHGPPPWANARWQREQNRQGAWRNDDHGHWYQHRDRNHDRDRDRRHDRDHDGNRDHSRDHDRWHH